MEPLRRAREEAHRPSSMWRLLIIKAIGGGLANDTLTERQDKTTWLGGLASQIHSFSAIGRRDMVTRVGSRRGGQDKHVFWESARCPS